MPFARPKHVKENPHVGMRVAHWRHGAGEIISVFVKNQKQLCIVRHDDGSKRGHYWSGLTDDQVPAYSAPRAANRPAVA